MPRTHAHWLKVQLDDEENEILNQVATDHQQSKTTIVRSLIRSLDADRSATSEVSLATASDNRRGQAIASPPVLERLQAVQVLEELDSEMETLEFLLGQYEESLRQPLRNHIKDRLSSLPPDRQQKIYDRTQQLTTAEHLRAMAGRLLDEYNQLIDLADELESDSTASVQRDDP